MIQNEQVKEHSESLKLDSNSPPGHHPSTPITPDAESLAEHSNAEEPSKNDVEGSTASQVPENRGSSSALKGDALVSQPNGSFVDTRSDDAAVYKRNQPKIRRKLSAPSPIAKRGRVVSLDRRGYLHNDDDGEDEDDDDLSSSQNSSDDGSYFSEQLLSPTSCARKTEFAVAMLPPARRSHSVGGPSPSVGQPYGFQRSHSLGQNSYSSVGSKHQDSDLSLSSSSNDEYNSTMNGDNLKQSYPMIRTSSAPETYRRRPSLTIKPRSDIDSDVDLGPVSNDISSLHKPPMPAREVRQGMYASDGGLSLKQKGSGRFPSGSSLVSSSSEDTGDPHFEIENISSSNIRSDRDQDNLSGTQRSRHRRQQSSRSLDSQDMTNDGQVENVWKSSLAIDVESELSDADSFMNNRRRRKPNHKRSDQSLTSADSRIPLEIPNVTLSGSRGQTSSLHRGSNRQLAPTQVSLSEEQLKTWQNGMVRSESYMSSSLSPERKHSVHSSESNNSVAPGKNMSATSFVYSEDDTDESARQKELLLGGGIQGGRETDETISFSLNGKKIKQFVARDRMKSNTELSTKDHSADFESSGRSTEMHSSCNISRKSKMPTGDGLRDEENDYSDSQTYKVYWQRWLMLFYMSVLNLVSDWTCYSVAPIANLTTESFGDVNPEHLVTVFLAANAIATAFEPVLLARLGLRKMIVFGAFLLMSGSVIKSGGIPGITGTGLADSSNASWRIYTGFLLVGLSQPLYQCTPTLLSCAWFPEKERTLATGIALNSNQLGVGFAFVFGTMLVLSTEDIPKYFGLLSSISTLTFLGCFLQFKDAPPTPPSNTARVIRGTLEVKIPYIDNMRQSLPSLRSMHISNSTKSHRPTLSAESGESRNTGSSANTSGTEHRLDLSNRPRTRSYERNNDSPNSAFKNHGKPSRITKRSSSGREVKNRRSSRSRVSSTDKEIRHSHSAHGHLTHKDINKQPSPSSGLESTKVNKSRKDTLNDFVLTYGSLAPSPMMNGRTTQMRRREGDRHFVSPPHVYNGPFYAYSHMPMPGYTPQGRHSSGEQTSDFSLGYLPDTPFATLQYPSPQTHDGYSSVYQPSPFYPQNYTQQFQPYVAQSYRQHQHYPPIYPPEYYQYQQNFIPAHPPITYPPQVLQYCYAPTIASSRLPAASVIDDGAEPVLSQAGGSLDIEIRDDQILRSIKACFSRKGFVHTVVAFAVSGIVLNTLNTYMDYLLRLDGSGRQTVGVVGGCFQLIVMISSIFIAKVTDKTRAYYAVIIGLLLLGAFALAECNISLYGGREGSLKWSLLCAAVLIGPLQPISTELAVDVSYPLCANTVLVIQQLVSNLFSALFIPLFLNLRDYGTNIEGRERPQYTFSFYLLIVIHGVATVFFATFNGKYMRLAHEQKKKSQNRKISKSKQRYETNGYIHASDTSYDEEKASLLK